MRWSLIIALCLMGCGSENEAGGSSDADGGPAPIDVAGDEHDAPLGENLEDTLPEDIGDAMADLDIGSLDSTPRGDVLDTQEPIVEFNLVEGNYKVMEVNVDNPICNANFDVYLGSIWPITKNEFGWSINTLPVEVDGNEITGGYSETVNWGNFGFCDCVQTMDYIFGGEVLSDGSLLWEWDTTWSQSGGSDCGCLNEGAPLPCSFVVTFLLEYQGLPEVYELPDGAYTVTGLEVLSDSCYPDFSGYLGSEWPVSSDQSEVTIVDVTMAKEGNSFQSSKTETVDWGAAGFCDCVTTDYYEYKGQITGQGALTWEWNTTWTQSGGTDCSCIGNDVELPCTYLAVFWLEWTETDD